LSYAELYDEFFPRGLHQEALVAAANRMIELEPNSAEGYAIRASLKSDNSSPDEILTDLLRAIELDSNYQFPQTLLAVVYLDSENFQDAIVAAERAIQIDDANVVPYWVIARANRLLGRLEQSVDYGLLAIERNEKYVDAYCELGEAYAEQGKTAEAIEVLDKALELAPNDSEILLYKTKLENPEKS
jgi:superkiller protein 3